MFCIMKKRVLSINLVFLCTNVLGMQSPVSGYMSSEETYRKLKKVESASNGSDTDSESIGNSKDFSDNDSVFESIIEEKFVEKVKKTAEELIKKRDTPPGEMYANYFSNGNQFSQGSTQSWSTNSSEYSFDSDSYDTDTETNGFTVFVPRSFNKIILMDTSKYSSDSDSEIYSDGDSDSKDKESDDSDSEIYYSDNDSDSEDRGSDRTSDDLDNYQDARVFYLLSKEEIDLLIENPTNGIQSFVTGRELNINEVNYLGQPILNGFQSFITDNSDSDSKDRESDRTSDDSDNYQDARDFYLLPEEEIDQLIENPTNRIQSFIIDRGLNINEVNCFNEPILIYMASEGHTAVVKELIKNGADINTQDRYHHTALTRASQAGHKSIVEFLLDNINVDVKDDRLKALSWAAKKGRVEVIDLFLKNYPDLDLVNFKDKYGNSLLSMAIRNNQEATVKFLLENNVDIKDDQLEALSWATQNGRVEVIDLFLKNYPDLDLVNFKDKYGNSLLSIAIRNNQEATTKFLLENGAKINEIETNEEEKSPRMPFILPLD